MATRERMFDRGTRLARLALARLGTELRDARLAHGLSLREAAAAAGISASELGRIERTQAPRVPLIGLFRVAAVVGLDLSVRAFAGSAPLRDAAHASLLCEFRSRLNPSLRWATEVPLPTPGDRRAWDALVTGSGWRYAVEAETTLHDAQALTRRLTLKLRDGGVDGVVLVLQATRRVREALRASGLEDDGLFTVDSRRALDLLGRGFAPGGSSLVLIPSRRASGRRP